MAPPPRPRTGGAWPGRGPARGGTDTDPGGDVTDDLLLFTVEADGEPVTVMAHEDLRGARDTARGSLEEYVLLGACKDGADLLVRAARGGEKERWHAAVRHGRQEGDIPSPPIRS